MKRNLRLPLFIILIVTIIGIGTMGAYASTDCQHLFLAYEKQLAKHLHHKVSHETLARWAAWNKAHPHYHPTRKESLEKIDFVCQVPTDDTDMGQDLPPVSLPPLLTSMTDEFPNPNDNFPAPGQPKNAIVSNLVPPDNPQQPPTGDPLYPPVYYPGPPTLFNPYIPLTPPVTPPITPTPEPGSLVFMTTALAMMSGLIAWRRRQTSDPRPQSTRS